MVQQLQHTYGATAEIAENSTVVAETDSGTAETGEN